MAIDCFTQLYTASFLMNPGVCIARSHSALTLCFLFAVNTLQKHNDAEDREIKIRAFGINLSFLKVALMPGKLSYQSSFMETH